MLQKVWRQLKQMLGQKQAKPDVSESGAANVVDKNKGVPTASMRERLPFKISGATGFPPGSIGNKSVRLGYDWRDLKIAGYTDADFDGVLRGEYTLEDLFKRKPAGKPKA